MKAGRDLDMLIAEKVMGFPMYSEHGITQKEYEFRRKRIASCPEYSFDIAEAWVIVGKMTCEGCLVNLNGGHVEWECEVTMNDGRFLLNGDTVVLGRGETAPLAICLAALKAVGVNK